LKNIPGFTADGSLRMTSEQYESQTDFSPREAVISPAFKVNCGTNTALGALCTALGVPAAFFPCFFNSGCMWFHAGLANPACFRCTYV